MHDQEWSKNDRPTEPSGKGISPSLIVTIIAAALAVTFILQNRADATIKGLFWTTSTPMWVVIIVSMILGAVLGWLAPRLLGRRDT